MTKKFGFTNNVMLNLFQHLSAGGDEGSPLTPTLSRRARGKRAAFTLAEVLITLAIIGVVAAITIPTLVMGYKKKVTEVNLLKSYSMINQALQLSSIDNGTVNTWDKNLSDISVYYLTKEELTDWFNKYLKPYLRNANLEENYRTITDSEGNPVSEARVRVLLNNGVILQLQTKHPYDTGFIFDGGKTEEAGFNSFPFRFVEKNGYLRIEPYSFTSDDTMDTLKYADEYGCYEASRGKGMFCTKLIQENGWKIPEDYPYFK